MNAQAFGILTLVPPLTAIILAFITRNVILSLFLGVFSGCYMLVLQDWSVLTAIFGAFLKFTFSIRDVLSSKWNAGIILQCLAIGGMIALISKTGGTNALAQALARRARSPRSAQLITWFMGLLIFFDDYANSLTIGPTMRPVTDRMRISREKLAFIIDGTAAPIAGLALISTWIAYELGLIQEGYAQIGVQVNAYGVFIDTIPYRFYNILILVFILLTIIMMREFGPMYSAEKRARLSGKVLSDNAKPLIAEEATTLQAGTDIKPSVWYAIIPISTLIIATLAGFYYNGYSQILAGKQKELIDIITHSPLSARGIRAAFGASNASVVLFQSALAAGIIIMIMAVAKRALTLKLAIETWLTGIKSMNITVVILLLAWALSGIIKELGTAAYISSILSGNIAPYLLPSIIFIAGSVISFATGTSYGTMGILMPLAIPLSNSINPDPGYIVLNVSAVLTGAIFGDHCSPISDTTILSSMGAACDHIDHTKTQIFYALPVAAISVIFGYLPAGLGMPLYISLPAGLLAVAAVIFIFGKKTSQN